MENEDYSKWPFTALLTHFLDRRKAPPQDMHERLEYFAVIAEINNRCPARVPQKNYPTQHD